MKKFLLKGAAVFAMSTGLMLSGCELFDKVDDVTFDAKLPVDFVIDEQMESDVPVAYTDMAILDATDDAEVAKYKDKIREIRLNKITYVIEGYSAPGTVVFSNGTLSMAGAGTLATASAITLQNTPETELTSIDQAGFNEFANQIMDDKQVTINLGGTFSTTPVAFNLRAYFHVTITADALK